MEKEEKEEEEEEEEGEEEEEVKVGQYEEYGIDLNTENCLRNKRRERKRVRQKD